MKVISLVTQEFLGKIICIFTSKGAIMIHPIVLFVDDFGFYIQLFKDRKNFAKNQFSEKILFPKLNLIHNEVQ